MKALKVLEKIIDKCYFTEVEEIREAIEELEEFKIKSSLNHGKLLSLEIENRTLKTLLDRATKSEESLTLEIEALDNRSCENCKNDYVDIDDNCERCNRYYEDKFEIKEK